MHQPGNPFPRAARTLCVVALLVLGSGAMAATDFSVEASRKGELIEVRARATIAAPVSVIWGTLTDYERLPEFIPGLKRSRVLSRAGATTTVEQSGEARFLFLSVPIEITLESTERPPNIDVRRIAGNVRYLQGRYEIEVQSNPSLVQLRWTGAIAPETDLPPLVGEALMRLTLEEQFSGMVNEIERREALREQNAATPGSTPRLAAPPPVARPQNTPGSQR